MKTDNPTFPMGNAPIIETFTNSDFGQVRAVEIDGEAWLVGKDVATILGYSVPRKAIIDHVDIEDKRGFQIGTPSGKQHMIVINESGLYSLVMSSRLRLQFAEKLLEAGYITVVRGNFSECSALLHAGEEDGDRDNGGHGVDSAAAQNQAETFKLVRDCAARYGCIFIVSGATDCVSDGKRAVVLNGGNPLMTSITGAGCMATTIVAACVAVADDKMEGAILGMIIMGQAAELSAGLLEKKDGPGMFKVRLIDCIYHVVHKWNLIQDNLNPTREN